jgi:hypothetical protein
MKYVIDASTAFQWEVPEPDSLKAIQLREDYRNGIHELSITLESYPTLLDWTGRQLRAGPPRCDPASVGINPRSAPGLDRVVARDSGPVRRGRASGRELAALPAIKPSGVRELASCLTSRVPF